MLASKSHRDSNIGESKPVARTSLYEKIKLLVSESYKDLNMRKDGLIASMMPQRVNARKR